MKTVDITGRRFGRLLIVAALGTRPRENKPGTVSWWQCKCDCGNIVQLPKSSLISGLTKSCGCLLKERTVDSNIRRRKAGSAFKNLLCRYKKTAEQKGLEFNLTDEEFRMLTSSHCYWTGRSPQRTVITACGHDTYVYNGIDRLNNSLGYILSNCVASCFEANSAKSTLTAEEFLQLCRDVVNKHGL